MTKTNIEVIDFEDKTTQAGKGYTRFKTSAGWISCFDLKLIKELKELKGKNAVVELVESGEFKNIKKVYDSTDADKAEVEVVKMTENKNASKKEMYVSYAKDCFCAIVTRISQSKFDAFEEADTLKLMDLAIACVKKAETSFN